MKFGPKYKWFKISYLEFFFLKYYFGHTFLCLPRRSSEYYQRLFFFLIWDFPGESLKANKNSKKITHFIIQFRSKNLTHFTNLNSLDTENNMLPQHGQKPFWLYKFPSKHVSVWCQKNICTAPFPDTQKLYSWSTLKANVCIFLYISLRKFLFQRHSVLIQMLYLVGVGMGGWGWVE